MSIVGSVTVRVVPSFSGVHKQIAQQMTGAASQAGSQAARSMSRSMSASLNLQSVGKQIQSVGDNIASVGSQLTKSITLPVAGAVTAVGGLTAALGWKRLVSLDTAQGQLRGLGYEAEEVERITGQVSTALEGGMMTLGEGAGVAAGALAAGVEEGQELERYIGLVDSASVGMNTSAAETAGIFNRIQGSGKLMRNELEMIEYRMPGFQNAVADSLGVTVDEMFNMVSAGEVTSDQFLDVMENFAGGMAEEHAKTWEGMVQNTLAYVGILGENILSGVFQMSKDELGLFILELKEAGDSEWAKQLGEIIGDVFSSVVGAIKSAVSWWQSLDSEQQKAIGKWAGIAVAAGPVLFVFGRLLGFAGGLITNIGKVVGLFSRFSGIMARAGGAGLRFVPVIGGIVGGFMLLWEASEGFRDAIGRIFTKVVDAARDAFERLKPAVMGVWDSLTDLWDVLSEEGGILDWLGTIVGWVLEKFFDWQLFLSGIFVDVLVGAMDVIGWLIDKLTDLIGWLQGLGDETTTQGGIWAAVWEWISSAVSWAWENVIKPAWSAMQWAWGVLSAAISWAWEYLIKPAWDALVAFALWMWEYVIQPVWSAIQWAWDKLSAGIAWSWENVIKPAWDALVMVLTWLWENVVGPVFNWIIERWQRVGDRVKAVWDGFLSPVFSMVGAIILWLWENVAKPYFRLIWETWVKVGKTLWNTWTEYIWPAIQRFGQRVMELWNNYISPALSWISDKWDSLKDKILEVWNDHVRPTLKRFGDYVQNDLWPRVKKGIDLISDAWEDVKGAFAEPINWVIRNVWNKGIVGSFNKVADVVGADKMSEVSEIGAYAKGGRAPRGWALVGEEGPELVNFSNPGRVYTASETQAMLGGTDAPMTNEEVAAAAGDDSTPFGIGNWLLDGLGAIADATGISGALDWARGALADSAEKLMEPLLESLSSTMSRFGLMGGLASGVVDHTWDAVLDWIRGKDEEEMAAGFYDGEFTANPGGFNRPAAGPITSPAGPRSYVGRFGNMHYGIDIGVPIGSAIRSAWDGVIKSRGGGGLNQTVVVNHGAFDTAYMHNSAILKSPGTKVSGGEVIARSGTAGSGPHLHFELHPGGYYNPSIGGVNSLFRDKGGLIYPGMNQVLNKTGKAEYVFNQQQFENLNRLAERGGNGSGDTFIQHVHNNGSPYRDGADFKRHVSRSRRKAGV